eukprot:scaffold84657_cov53-Attheya_sp.AAC.3
MKIKLGAVLLLIAYKSKDDANKHMAAEKLNYKAVCPEAVTLYRKFKGRGQWLPAKNLVDHNTPPRNYGANVASSSPVLCGTIDDSSPLAKAQALTLIHQRSTVTKGAKGSSEKTGLCHNYNKPGHWRNQCPELKSKSAGRGGSRSNQSRNSSAQGQNLWRTTLPSASEPNTKKKNGKTFNWCNHCTHWTTTHNIAGHTTKERRGAWHRYRTFKPEQDCQRSTQLSKCCKRNT